MKIVHLSDIHLMNKLEYQTRQEIVVENTIKAISQENPDRIVIVGDLFHDFIKPNNETKILAGKLLSGLSKIAKTIITQGNHDLNMKSVNRTDSIKVIIDLLNNDNIVYYNNTDFYEDDSLVWCVWHHSDKISPWVKNPNYQKDENKIYIDLFHDPINNAKTFFGQSFNDSKYVTLKDFKGDIAMLGDIHQYQLFYNDDKSIKAIYPSSLYQNNYGESVEKHGFVVWNIDESIRFKHIEVENFYSYINCELSGDIDYDNLDIPINPEYIKKYTHIKVKWIDYSSNINLTNWRKIKEYLTNLYGDSIVELKKDEKKIYDNKIESNDYIRKSLSNINSKNVQQDIFRNFLIEKKYDDDYINDVLIIDDIINTRLNISESDNQRKNWRLVSFYLDNYRSHGDRFDMNWDNQNGIYQILGENAVGKTNLLSSIMYLFFGKTLETLKKESNGDNRFINNKRNLDYCEVGAVIDIENTLYNIVRRTERKWDKNKTKITSTPTTLAINVLDNDNNIINLTDEEKSKTQKFVESAIGSFDDFLSLYIVNADTLNNLLSVDESVFIDTILRYSGLDIFEKKLNMYKEYKKEVFKKQERIVLNIEEENDRIVSIENKIDSVKQEISDLNTQLEDSQNRYKKGLSMKEDEIKKLHIIDNNLINTSLDSISNEIKQLNSKKDDYINFDKQLDIKIAEYRNSYDKENYLYHIKIKDELLNKQYSISSSIKDCESKINNLKNDIILCDNQIINNNTTISNNNNLIEQEITNLKSKIDIKKQNIEIIIKNIDNNIKNIEKEISVLENSKTCPSCDRILGDTQITVIQSKILEKNKEIIALENSKKDNENIIFLQNEILDIEISINQKDNDNIIGLKNKNDKLLENNTLQNSKKIEYQNDILNINNEIDILKSNLQIVYDESLKNQDLIADLEIQKQEFDKRNELISKKESIPIHLENLDLKINNNQILYNNVVLENEKYINNQNIQKIIDNYDNRLNTLLDNVNTIQSLINEKNNEIKSLKLSVSSINDNINKFKIQERNDNVNKTYLECIHRDGLPKLLLLRMRDDINNEIHNLINGLTNFNLYFDESMILKMYTCNDDTAIQNVISGSGMERTFISIILKLALRDVNNKSLGDFLFLDEITGKLVGESVTNFFELLHRIKQKIDKIIIIEHAYSDMLEVDYSINVIADNGVSKILL